MLIPWDPALHVRREDTGESQRPLMVQESGQVLGAVLA